MSRKLKDIDVEKFASSIKEAVKCIDSDDPLTLLHRYSQVIESTLDVHVFAPVKSRKSKGNHPNPWYTDVIHFERILRRKAERKYVKTGLEVDRQLFQSQSKRVIKLISHAETTFYKNKLSATDSKDLFNVIDKLISENQKKLPKSNSEVVLAERFGDFFHNKVSLIRRTLDNTSSGLNAFEEHHVPSRLIEFAPVSEEHVRSIIGKSKSTSCSLDPLQTWLLKSKPVLDALLPFITAIINSSIAKSCVPTSLKTALVIPLLKKPSLDCEILKNYRPVSNLEFIGKVLERVIARQITNYLQANDLHEPLQSAYKGQSTETALLKVKADIDSALDSNLGIKLYFFI
ncbi:hypothetical protein SNE40_005900 [Patella caerulea]|uniref:Reverse transcriptase domain-containing protein n=1 Tax=Patella caerulea TaxID=87958 RepID=A0AAN8K0F0_PATCE